MFFWKNNYLNRTSIHQGRQALPLFVFLMLCVLLTACHSKSETYSGYFPVDSLVNSQIKHLVEVKASVKKVSSLNNQNEEKTFTPTDTIAWRNELDIFLELESVNKPMNKDAYTVTDGLPDSKSNLRVMVVESKTNTKMSRDLPIKYLKIYYQDKKSNVRKIEAQVDETNVLYKSSRQFLLEFQNVHDALMLTSYQMRGGQKMFMGDTVAYSITGVITLQN